MEKFYERFLILVSKTSKSINQIERELGYPRNALHNYKNVKSPSAERLMQLAKYFGVSSEYFLGGDEEQVENTYSIHTIKSIFDNFNTEDKIKMYNYCHEWLISQLLDIRKHKDNPYKK